jgi:hypothetical protein
MDNLSSIPFATNLRDKVVLQATGINLDPVRVLLMSEVDYQAAMQSRAEGGRMTGRSTAMPILSADRPSVTLNVPGPGKWRIVYQTSDADSVTVQVVPAPQ